MQSRSMKQQVFIEALNEFASFILSIISVRTHEQSTSATNTTSSAILRGSLAAVEIIKQPLY